MMKDINAARKKRKVFAGTKPHLRPPSPPPLFAAIIACAYAIALLVIFTSPDVKRYYEGLRKGTE